MTFSTPSTLMANLWIPTDRARKRSAVITGVIAGAIKTIKYQYNAPGQMHGQVFSIAPDTAGQVRGVSVFDNKLVDGVRRLILLVFYQNKITGKDNDSDYFALIEDNEYVPVANERRWRRKRPDP